MIYEIGWVNIANLEKGHFLTLNVRILTSRVSIDLEQNNGIDVLSADYYERYTCTCMMLLLSTFVQTMIPKYVMFSLCQITRWCSIHLLLLCLDIQHNFTISMHLLMRGFQCDLGGL